MYCPNCRSQLIDGSVYCPVCGTQLAQVQQMNYQRMNYQQPIQQPMMNNAGYVQQPVQQKSLGMKWFKFLIYFQLFMACIVSIGTGIMLVTGKIYTTLSTMEVDLLYMYFPGLKTFNVCMGVVYCILGIIYLVTRFMLSGYKKAGPPMLIAIYVGSLLISIIQVVITIQIVSGTIESVSITTIASVLTSIIMIICNIVYFRKRKHLFIN